MVAYSWHNFYLFLRSNVDLFYLRLPERVVLKVFAECKEFAFRKLFVDEPCGYSYVHRLAQDRHDFAFVVDVVVVPIVAHYAQQGYALPDVNIDFIA